MRLIDHLLAVAPPDWRSELMSAYVIVLDRAAETWTNLTHDHWELPSLQDLPNVTPPFRKLWLEARVPCVDSLGRPAVGLVGAFIRSAEMSDSDMDDGYRQLFETMPDARWVCDVQTFTETGPDPVGAAFGVLPNGAVVTGKTGLVTDHKTGAHMLEAGVRGNPRPVFVHRGDSAAYAKQASELWRHGGGEGTFRVLAPAISLMHCKNVSLTHAQPAPGIRVSGRKHGVRPLVRYHTLEIEPMRKVLRSEGGLEANGVKKALHICRGHFKDYRQSGLFGKFKGLYWWDQHARGDVKLGVVEKDYAIKMEGA